MRAIFFNGPAAVLALAGLALFAAGCGSSRASSYPSQHFRSRPGIRPPNVDVLKPAHDTAPGYLFLSPERGVDQAGPMIIRDNGQVVWFHPSRGGRVTNFRVQRYHGRSVLTWWSALPANSGHTGLYVIADDRYHVFKTFAPAGGYQGDLHEFLLTPRGTAIISVYRRIPYDLSSIGGSSHGAIWEGIVQEIDVATGRLLWHWDSIDHVGVGESYEGLPSEASKTYDYFHINSIDPLPNGNLLVSGRNTHAVYEIRKSDGAVLWRLGGKRSDFAFGPGARFAWQHDARQHPGGLLSVFDNHAEYSSTKGHARGLLLRVDMKRHRVTLVRAYHRRSPVLATSEGNAQFLPDGHVVVGWGSAPFVTEFSRDGRVLLDLRIGSYKTRSYRSFRFPWVGHPTTKPSVAAVRHDNGTTVYMSWNGATQVTGWRVLAGPSADRLEQVATSPVRGFETAIKVGSRASVFRVAALDRRGRVLRMSDPVRAAR